MHAALDMRISTVRYRHLLLPLFLQMLLMVTPCPAGTLPSSGVLTPRGAPALLASVAGIGSSLALLEVVDADGDGYNSDVDCNDADPTVNPGRREVVHNGKDDDCNPATLDNWSQGFIIGSDDSSYLYYARSNGDGTFSGYRSLGQYGSGTGRGVIIEDFNGDGSLDFIAGSSSGAFYLFLNDGADTFTNTGAVGSHPTTSYIVGMGAGDFNNDGRMDFVANGNTSTTIAIFLNDGRGGFTRSTITGSGNGRGLDVADVDGDGILDFVRAAIGTNDVWLYRGNGDGTFTGTKIGTATGSSSDNYAVAAADFDSDGKVDLIVGGSGNGNPYFFKGNGDGTFQLPVLVTSLDTGTYNAIDAYDFNNDGKTDIVLANYSGKGIRFYPGNGDGTFGAAVAINTSATTDNVLAVSAPPTGNPAGFPVADAEPKSQTVNVGAPASLNGTWSSGSLSAYDWKFGDGTTGAGITTAHTYASEGIFAAALTVTDTASRKDTDVARVTVLGTPPVANAGGPYTFGESYASLGIYTVPLNGAGSSDDSGIASYLWDFGTPISDTFAGTVLDTTTWIASAGVTQNETASITGAAAWTTRYLCSQETFLRDEGVTIEFKVKPGAATTQSGMFGVKDTGTNYSYTQMPHAFYFNSGNLQIYEGGTNRGVFATYTRGVQYDLKLVLRTAGAFYYLRETGKPFWRPIYTSSYSSLAPLKFGTTINTDTFEIDDVQVRLLVSGQNPTKQLLAGTHHVTLTVTDTVGQQDTDTTTVTTAPGVPPVANPGGPYTFGENVASKNKWTATLDGSGSTDDVGVVSYSWDFGDGTTGTGMNPTHAYTGPGPYTATLTVTDRANQTNSAATTVTLTAGAVPAANPGGPYTAGESAASQNKWTVNLSSAASSDDFGIWKYAWNFGDGTTSTLANPSHAFTGPGPYTVTLTVTDNANQTTTAATTVTLTGGEFPVARPGGPYTVPEAQVVNNHWSISVDASASTDDFGVWKYEWNFGDGSAVVTTTAPTKTATHTYNALGTYTVTLTVTDNANQSHSATTTAYVVGTALPTAEAGGPYFGEPNTPILFDGTASTDDVAIVSSVWDFGDGTPPVRSATPEHAYSAPGTYTVNLTITDQALQTAVDTATVTVAVWNPPNADTGGPYTSNVDLPLRLDGSRSTDDFGIASYAWTVGPLSMFLQDSFGGTTINASRWLYPATGVTQNEAITLTGGSGWGTRYLFSSETFDSFGPMEFQGQVTSTAAGNLMIGFKDSSTSYGYTVMPYAVYFNNGTFDVYEGGNNRSIPAPVPTYALNTVYDVKIVLKQDTVNTITGARYYYKLATATDWILLYDSAYVTSSKSMKVGASYHSGTFVLDNLLVSGGTLTVTGARPMVNIAVPGTFPVQLTVTDGAGQTSTATTTLTVSPGPAVITVPWQFSGGTEVSHDTWSGEEVILKAVVKSRREPLTYTWDFGDTTRVSGTVTNKYDVSARHTYTAADGTPIVARLTVTDADGRSSSDTFPIIVRPKTLDVEVNKAIEDALWYIHTTQDRTGTTTDGRWSGYSSYYSSPTASALHALEINGHLEVGDIRNDPYVEDVWRGMRYLLTTIQQAAITDQPYGYPDLNGNGIGIEVTSDRPIYEGGQVMMALVASAMPDMKAETGGTGVRGRTYKQIVADMAEMYYWGQRDDATSGGGWRYDWNYSSSDNSACQWPALGFEAAEEQNWIKVPQWVKDRNLVWLDYSRGSGGIGYGYTGSGNGEGTSPSGLAQLAFIGIPTTDDRWKKTELNLAQNWNSWYTSGGNYYAFYALAKAMRIAKPNEITVMAEGTANAIDWYNDPTRGLARIIINQQDANGQFVSSEGYVTGPFKTAWGVIILTKTLFVLPPVAVAGDNKVWGVDLPLTFDGSKSYHLDPSRRIVLYEWDFDGDGVYDASSPGPTAPHTYSSAEYPLNTLPRTFTVTLRVTDDNVPPKYDTDTLTVIIAEPPHPPVAVPGGPYIGYVGIPLQLDGSASYDIDPVDTITSYGWELDNVYPYTFADATIAKPTYTWNTTGTFNVGLQVFDNGVMNSGVKLSDTKWTTVTIRANHPPVARAGGPYTVSEGNSVTLEGTGSSDPDGNPLTYAWDLDNDGTYETTGGTVTFSRPNNGSFTVGLKVTDGALTATDTAVVTVTNVAPTVNAGIDKTFAEGGTFTGSGSFIDPGTDTWTATVDYGDGSATQPLTLSGKNFSLSHLYTQNGVYTVTVTVTDSDGGAGSDIAVATVTNVAPTVNAGPDKTTTQGETFSSSGSFTDPGSDTWTATVDYGDGSGVQSQALSGKNFSLSHTYTQGGSFTVTVRVTDADGGTGSDTVRVTVKALSTVALTSSLNPSIVGQPVTFSATVSPAAATGTVTFMDGATTLGTVTLSVGKATYTTASLTAGNHSITAVYSGDGSYDGATSPPLTQTVKYATITVLSSSLNPSAEDQSVTFTATVSPAAATGTVTFKDGTTTLGTTSLSGGNAIFSTATLTAGTHSITASYNGDGSYIGSTSSPVSQVIGLVVIDGTTQYFSQIQKAYDASSNGAIIKAQGVTFSENLLLNTAGKSVTIKGGYTPGFTTQSGYSTINGKLTIGKGGLVADRLVIR